MNRASVLAPDSAERAQVDESGQVLVLGLIVAIALVMVSVTVANVGMLVAEKIHLQDTVDASAYSAAVVEARYMNLSAYVNRAMVANYNSMAFNTALWATVDANDHGLAVVADLLYKLSEVLAAFIITIPLSIEVDSAADLIAAVHDPLHTFNKVLNELFAQDEQDLNQFIEVYNIYGLTMYQGLLYASLQADRFRVVKAVAEKMDPEVLTTTTLGVAAESVSYDELAKAVDWVIEDTDARGELFNLFNKSFDRLAGKDSDTQDHPRLLAAVTEASIDKFVAGRDRKGQGDLLRAFNTANFLDALGVGGFGFDFNMSLGASVRFGQENEAAQVRVPVIARRRMRETNFFGFTYSFDSSNPFLGFIADALDGIIPNSFGHTSGDKFNDVANAANATLAITEGFDVERAIQCMLTGTGCAVTAGIPAGGLNALNIAASATMLPIPLLGPPVFVDDHWDGAYDSKPVRTHQVWPEPFSGKVDGVRYVADVASGGFEEGVPKYDWIVDLNNVGFPHYHYPDTDAERRPLGNTRGSNDNLLTGPSLAVVGVKRAKDLKGLRGLKIGPEKPNNYPLTAIARSQVYYLRNPKRPDERPSLFNPHWAARLAPIDSEDTPDMVKEVLPFVSSLGVPITPTH
ncbi:MAG: Tad domain-containing protein [Bdellovibrionales bacterium]|nr:Tad domain-containing protein [Bdellovibrionales bacterium]